MLSSTSHPMLHLRVSVVGVIVFLALLGEGIYIKYGLENDCWKNGSVSYYLTEEGEKSAAILKATTNHTSYSWNMHCRVVVVAPPRFHVLASFREIDLRTNLDGSCKDYLEIDYPQCERLVRYDEVQHTASKDNVLRITYHTAAEGLNNRTLSGYAGFTIILTAFQKGSEVANISSKSFRCSNDNYIWSGLTCDEHNNCGDRSDEDVKGNSNCANHGPTVLIILGLLIVAVLVIMCVATLLCSKNEAVRRFSTRLRSRTISMIPRFGNK